MTRRRQRSQGGRLRRRRQLGSEVKKKVESSPDWSQPGSWAEGVILCERVNEDFKGLSFSSAEEGQNVGVQAKKSWWCVMDPNIFMLPPGAIFTVKEGRKKKKRRKIGAQMDPSPTSLLGVVRLFLDELVWAMGDSHATEGECKGRQVALHSGGSSVMWALLYFVLLLLIWVSERPVSSGTQGLITLIKMLMMDA